MRKGSDLRYIHQDHLTGTAIVTSDNGTLVGSTKYYPYGDCRNSQGTLGTDKLFTGQRLDDTGLYYYGARYYDPTIGRFISPDTFVQNCANPQTLNRYSYVLNNPLKYIDPTGLIVEFENEEEILKCVEVLAACGDIPSPEMLDLIMELLVLQDAWEKLKHEEPEYTQHIEESEITFNVVDIDLPSKTISYVADMPLISFDEPVQLSFVSGVQMAATMYGATGFPLSPGGVSLYPDPIYMRTDIDRSTDSFTWLVAHESYHRWEQSLYVNSYWYDRYIGELIRNPLAHDKWPSEIRANKYATVTTHSIR